MSAAAVALASARLWMLLQVQASWRRALGPSWTLIAAALAVSLAITAALRGQLPSLDGWTHADLLVALLLELLLGGVLGLSLSLPGWALVGASDESGHALELRESSSAFAAMLVAASLAAGLSLGLHRPLCAGLLGLFDRFALAQASTWWHASAGSGAVLIEQAVAFTCLALALATPVLLTRVLVTLCVASLGRTSFAARSLVAVVGPGLRLGAGLLALGAAWSAYPHAFARGMS